jgi:hypothetical protein
LRNLQKGGKENGLHDCIRTSDSGADDTGQGRIPYENAALWQLEGNAEHKSPRMSWVVGSGAGGQRQLRIHGSQKYNPERRLLLTIVNYPCYIQVKRSAGLCWGRVER